MNPDIPENVFQSIIQAITSGLTVQAALDDHGVNRYDYDKTLRKYPIRKADHARARQDGVDAMADEVPHIADSEPDPQRAKNRMDARRWLASVIKPREYGQRLDLTVTPGLNPAELDAEGRQRLRLMRDQPAALLGQVVDAEVILEPGPTDSQSVSSPAPADADIFK